MMRGEKGVVISTNESILGVKVQEEIEGILTFGCTLEQIVEYLRCFSIYLQVKIYIWQCYSTHYFVLAGLNHYLKK